MEQNKILLTPQETSELFFGGSRSAWTLLQDAKKKCLPAIKIGNRVFFELNTLNDFFDKQLSASISTSNVTVNKNGIQKID